MKLFAPAAALCLLAMAGTSHAADPNLARNLAATCANCHGTDGHGVGGTEPLAGIPRDTLLRKLEAFASGEKPATIMHQIARGYTLEQRTLIAEHFAAQRR